MSSSSKTNVGRAGGDPGTARRVSHVSAKLVIDDVLSELEKLPVSLFGGLDAFHLDHRCCGDLRAGVVDREQAAVVCPGVNAPRGSCIR